MSDLAGPTPIGAVKKRDPAARSFKSGWVAGVFRPGTRIARWYQRLEEKKGEWVDTKQFKTDATPAQIANRLAVMQRVGKVTGMWRLENRGDKVRMILTKPEDKQVPEIDKKNGKGSPEEETLLSKRVLVLKPLGGGMNVTKLVTFTDGSKGVWKPEPKDEYPARRNITPGTNTEREVAAWKVAQLVGMQDMVPASVVTRMEGQRGVLMQWAQGKLADEVPDAKYDGKLGLAKAAAFDYVIGNEDRHDGNWILSPEGKLKLIDHGLAFPDKGEYRGANAYMFNKIKFMEGVKTPKEMAEPYVAAKQDILDSLQKVGLPRKALDGVAYRIDQLSRKGRWQDLPREGW